MSEFATGGLVGSGGGIWLDGCTPRYITHPAPPLSEAEARIVAAFDATPTPPEVREAALRDQVIEAMSWAETFDDGRIGQERAAELLDEYLAAYRAAVNALPELIAEVHRGRALREAVEGLAERFGWDTMREPDWTGQQVAEAIRAALAALDPS